MRTDDKTGPGDILGTGRWAVLKRAYVEFKDDNLSDWAASLTYYAVLALFPALLALVALVGIFGQYPQTTNALIDVARQVSGGNSALGGLQDTINGIVQNKGGAGALLGIGLAGAVWSASGYIGAFMRASNAIYEVQEGRPFWKLRPLQVAVTLVMVLLVALVGLFGQYPQTTNALIDILRQAGVDPSTLDGVKNTINGVVQNKGGAGALLTVGLLGAL